MSKPKQVNPIGGSGAEEDRDSACTPKWLAELIGRVKLDPATNHRSHVDAEIKLVLEEGSNGIVEGDGTWLEKIGGWFHYCLNSAVTRAMEAWVVFCNPPYARGEVIKWIRHYWHTRFIFLLRWDPRSSWFTELLPHCTHVWFPLKVCTKRRKRGTPHTLEDHPGRIEFEPPPGVTFSSNPFPHALYLRDPDPSLLSRLAPHGLLLPVDQAFLQQYLDANGKTNGVRVVHEDAGSSGEYRPRKGKPCRSRNRVPATTV